MKITQISAFLICFGVCVCACTCTGIHVCFQKHNYSKTTTKELVFLSLPLVEQSIWRIYLEKTYFFFKSALDIWWQIYGGYGRYLWNLPGQLRSKPLPYSCHYSFLTGITSSSLFKKSFHRKKHVLSGHFSSAPKNRQNPMKWMKFRDLCPARTLATILKTNDLFQWSDLARKLQYCFWTLLSPKTALPSSNSFPARKNPKKISEVAVG